MKKKHIKILLFIWLFLLIGACDYGVSSSNALFIVKNESGVEIIIKPYFEGYSPSHSWIVLQDGEQIEFNEHVSRGIPSVPPPSKLLADSIVVVFDTNDSIVHGPQGGASRNILVDENWVMAKKTDHYFEYLYTFTEADYQEAVRGN